MKSFGGIRWKVAQVSNLLYRRFPICRRWANPNDSTFFHALPVGNRRHSRLETCATSPSILIAVFIFVATHLCSAQPIVGLQKPPAELPKDFPKLSPLLT